MQLDIGVLFRPRSSSGAGAANNDGGIYWNLLMASSDARFLLAVRETTTESIIDVVDLNHFRGIAWSPLSVDLTLGRPQSSLRLLRDAGLRGSLFTLHVGITTSFDLTPYWSGSKKALLEAEINGDGKIASLEKIEYVSPDSGMGESRAWITMLGWGLEVTPTTEPFLKGSGEPMVSLLLHYKLRNPGEERFAEWTSFQHSVTFLLRSSISFWAEPRDEVGARTVGVAGLYVSGIF